VRHIVRRCEAAQVGSASKCKAHRNGSRAHCTSEARACTTQARQNAGNKWHNVTNFKAANPGHSHEEHSPAGDRCYVGSQQSSQQSSHRIDQHADQERWLD
jgi:hypothetical protein